MEQSPEILAADTLVPQSDTARQQNSISRSMPAISERVGRGMIKTTTSGDTDTIRWLMKKEPSAPVLIQLQDSAGYKNRDHIISSLQVVPVEKQQLSNDWLLAVVLLSVCVFTILITGFRRYVITTFQSVFDKNLATKQFNNRNIIQQRTFMLLNFLFYLNTAIFVTQIFIFTHYKPIQTEYTIICVAVGLILFSYYLIKQFSARVVGFLFNTDQFFLEYQYNILLINKIIGVFLLPFIIIIPFTDIIISKTVIYTGLVGIIFFIIVRIYMGFVIFVEKRLPLFYTFLYLCIFEILPVLIIIKVARIYL